MQDHVTNGKLFPSPQITYFIVHGQHNSKSQSPSRMWLQHNIGAQITNMMLREQFTHNSTLLPTSHNS